MKNQAPSRETIAERAYLLWEQAGRPTGRDEDFWLRAEAELTAPEIISVSPVIAPPISATQPPIVSASPVHQVPPPIKDAVQIPERRPARARRPKRA
jgi:hypothetical protein